jgi:hypothetical protein
VPVPPPPPIRTRIADLPRLPTDVRDLTLLEPQIIVHGRADCRPLAGRLDGLHKAYGAPAIAYRMVIQFRPALPNSAHEHEIYLAAAGPRAGYAVYRTAQHRTKRGDAPTSIVDKRGAERAKSRTVRSRSPRSRQSVTTCSVRPAAHANDPPQP